MEKIRSSFIGEELSQLQLVNRHRCLKKLEVKGDHQVGFQGRQLVNFSSNDYLGLSQDPLVKDCAVQAISKSGASASSSRLICGNLDLHEMLEAELADLKGKECALVFASGFTANLGLLSALVGRGDQIFSDELNHASIIDGCRLSRATPVVFRHGDLDHLEDLLKDRRSHGRRLVVSDSVFSMDGDLADIPGLVSICQRHDCWLMLDEAHATGVMGSKGGGLVEHFQDRGEVHPDKIDLLMGTLSKALGSFGGFVACSSLVRDYLINKSRPFIFSTALPPSAVGAALGGLKRIRPPSAARKNLRNNIGLMKSRLEQHGLSSGKSQTPIFPVLLGSDERALEMSERLIERGFFVPAIRPPSIPPGSSRLRITVTAGHSGSQIEALVDSLVTLRGDLKAS